MNAFSSVALVSLLTLASCSTHDPELEGDYGTCTESPEQLYENAAALMHKKSFKGAAHGFAKVQTFYPYSKWATQAQLMEAYCRYHVHQYEDAIDLFTLFIKLHPHNKDVPYAHYMIGLCHYERISIVERDQSDTQEALEAFQKVATLYPTCSYAKDARFKINFIHNHKAAEEMSVGRFYQKDKAYSAAINRFRTVIAQYPTSEQRPEALLRLMECYAALNMEEDFEATHAVLQLNHKDSVWAKEAERLQASRKKPLAPGKGKEKTSPIKVKPSLESSRDSKSASNLGAETVSEGEQTKTAAEVLSQTTSSTESKEKTQ